ncbi:Nuclear pore complex protein [Hordeum vulgare]|nr:Nuclear pore complex protein [Hordeum vulgare]
MWFAEKTLGRGDEEESSGGGGIMQRRRDLPLQERIRKPEDKNRKRLSSSNDSPMLETSVSIFSEARALHDGSSIPRRPNAGLLFEDVKQEAANYSGIDGLNGPKLFGSAKRTSLDGGSALNLVKLEDDMPREGETTSTTFASLLDSAIQGLMPFPDVILQFERTSNEELPEGLFMSPTTSHQEACRYVATDLTAQLCLRIVLWLEGLASQSLGLEKKTLPNGRPDLRGSTRSSAGVEPEQYVWDEVVHEWVSAPPAWLGATPKQEAAYLEHWRQRRLAEEHAEARQLDELEHEAEAEDEGQASANAATSQRHRHRLGDGLPLGWSDTDARRPHRPQRR